MANRNHLKILKRGVSAWNAWRAENPFIMPDLSHVVLSGQFAGDKIKPVGGYLVEDYRGINFKNTNLSGSDLSHAALTGADLSNADLSFTKLISVRLSGVDLTNAQMGWTTLVNCDLSAVLGLETIRHIGPSSMGMDTLYKSDGTIPDSFLRNAGMTDEFITFIPSLLGARQSIQFYSCFISYSQEDNEFARRLYSRLRQEKMRVWFALEDVKSGQKLHEQIERAIHHHDKLLLVLSESSIKSEWVITEIRNARRIEIQEKRRKLFPIRLVDFDTIRNWKCFDADIGKDLAVEIREYYIPDFSGWRQNPSFGPSFYRLLNDLKAEEPKGRA